MWYYDIRKLKSEEHFRLLELDIKLKIEELERGSRDPKEQLYNKAALNDSRKELSYQLRCNEFYTREAWIHMICGSLLFAVGILLFSKVI